MYYTDKRRFEIKKFLKKNGPSGFGQISKHLDEMKLGYKEYKGGKNNKGLAKTLEVLVKDRKIKKKEQKPYPVYSIIKDSELNFAIAGDQFCEKGQFCFFGSMDEKYWGKDVEFYPNDSYEAKFIKLMVTRYGFYIFAALLKGLDYWLLKTNGKQSNPRKVWFNHALDLSNQQEMLFTWFLDFLTKGRVDEDNIPENKKLIMERIDRVKKTIRGSYYKLSQMVDDYEFVYEKHQTVSRLKKSLGYKEKLKQLKF